MSINKNENNHLVIEKLTDLLKLSPEKLKNAKYSDFSGKYFEQINDEVIKLESKPKIQKIQKNNLNQQIIANENERNFQNQNKYKERSNIFEKNIEDNKINTDIYVNNINNIKNRVHYNKNEDKEEYILQYKSLGRPLSQNNNNICSLRSIDNIPIVGYNNYNLNNGENIYPIRKIIFNIYYNTIFGQEIGISGSNEQLGNWDKNRILFLNWSEGNKWEGELDLDEDNLEDFEFKFVLCQNKNIIFWEPGENNNVYFSALINEIKEYPKGRYNKYQYEYNKEDGELLLKCNWGNNN
jgi:hypothetical protein